MIAALQIQAGLRNGKTFLKNSFYTQPFKLLDITEDKTDATLRLMMMSSSPGILDEDEYKIQVELGEQCSVELETQSYQRLFHMKNRATQQMQVKMAKGSSFIFLPHPSVPHECSSFLSKNIFYLLEDCMLIWGEVLTCGRKLNGEVFRFSRYHSQTEIFLSGKLIVKENLLVAPASTNVNAIGQLEGFTHQSSFICICKEIPGNPALESIHEILSVEKDICFGVSTLSVNGIIIRLLGYGAEQLYNIQKTISKLVIAANKKANNIKTKTYAK
ncbi:MAG: urease accessory protein UreD [Chitinophagaceae bacterium]|nr:urease accessory protein UreD [Chitinophagaceae bacterium]